MKVSQWEEHSISRFAAKGGREREEGRKCSLVCQCVSGHGMQRVDRPVKAINRYPRGPPASDPCPALQPNGPDPRTDLMPTRNSRRTQPHARCQDDVHRDSQEPAPSPAPAVTASQAAACTTTRHLCRVFAAGMFDTSFVSACRYVTAEESKSNGGTQWFMGKSRASMCSVPPFPVSLKSFCGAQAAREHLSCTAS